MIVGLFGGAIDGQRVGVSRIMTVFGCDGAPLLRVQPNPSNSVSAVSSARVGPVNFVADLFFDRIGSLPLVFKNCCETFVFVACYLDFIFKRGDGNTPITIIVDGSK